MRLSIWDTQVGEQGGGGSTIATDEIAEENERLAAEIAAMQSQLSPGASSPSTLVHKLPPPKVEIPLERIVCIRCLSIRFPPKCMRICSTGVRPLEVSKVGPPATYAGQQLCCFRGFLWMTISPLSGRGTGSCWKRMLLCWSRLSSCRRLAHTRCDTLAGFRRIAAHSHSSNNSN